MDFWSAEGKEGGEEIELESNSVSNIGCLTRGWGEEGEEEVSGSTLSFFDGLKYMKAGEIVEEGEWEEEEQEEGEERE